MADNIMNANTRKTLCGMAGLIGLLLLCPCARGGETRTADLWPNSAANPAPTQFENVQPQDTVKFNVIIHHVDGYTLSHTDWDRSGANTNFLWRRITDMNSKLVNTAWEAGTTTVSSHGYWSKNGGGGSGGGGGLIHRWATGVASAGDVLGPDLVVKVSPATAGVSNGVSGSVFGTNVQTGAEVPVSANWSVSAPGYFTNGGNQDVHSVSFSSDEPESVQVTAVNNGPPARQGSASAQFVKVVSISADPAVVCLGNTNVSYTVTTTPVGHDDIVIIDYPLLVTPGIHEAVAHCGSSTTTCIVKVISAAFDVSSDDSYNSDGFLTDNREATVTIALWDIDDPTGLSFEFEAAPVEPGDLINKPGTAISFSPTDNPLVWRTSKIYWYGVLPDNCCWFNSYAYRFMLTISGASGSCAVSNEYGMVWPDDDRPAMLGNYSDSSLTIIHDPELVPGMTNSYRCLIEFGNFEKTALAINIPTTDQYSEETTKEEEFHVKQWLGQVHVNQGGQGDCFTAKGIKWMLGWVGEGPWYTYGSTPDEARAEAEVKLDEGEMKEILQSMDIWEMDQGFVELKSKEHADYNAAFTYHCTYEPIFGPDPFNHHHPAY
jgi:hypothetical protein